nr:uncharacterized protein LOC131278691 [Dasypus novemcinctus]
MCEIRKEREAEKKGHLSSSWEYEDRRNLQKRNLTVLAPPYKENDLDPRYWLEEQNRPYRKRDCGYWDFEQSKSGYVDYEEADKRRKDCMYNGSTNQGCGGYKDSENVDYGNLSPETKDTWLTGNPDVTYKARGYGKTNGYVNCKNLNGNPEASKQTQQWTGYRSLGDSLGNFGQPQNCYLDHRNFNYNLEVCGETNFYYRDLRGLYHVPGSYSNTNDPPVDIPDLNGDSDGKEFVKRCEGDQNVYQNDKIYAKTKTHTMGQDDFNTEGKRYDTLFINCEYKFQNYRGTDSLPQMERLEYSGLGKPGMLAFGSRGIFPERLQDEGTREDQGECDFGVPQGLSVGKSTSPLEEERKPNGPETWRRNSCLRRTAPNTLRRSEFVQNRKRTQGMNSASLPGRIKHDS